jgi:hypothetical protein
VGAAPSRIRAESMSRPFRKRGNLRTITPSDVGNETRVL